MKKYMYIIISTLCITLLTSCSLVKTSTGAQKIRNPQSQISSEVSSEISSEISSETQSDLDMSVNDISSQTQTDSDTSVNDISSENESVTDSSVITEKKEIRTDIKKITSDELLQIQSGCTYEEIIEKLGTNNYEDEALAPRLLGTYLVDDEYLIRLDYENEDEICQKSGQELLDEAKSIYPPAEYEEKLKEVSTSFAVVIGDGFIFSSERLPFVDYYSLSTYDAQIKFLNGQSATKEDIEIMDRLIVKYDYILESWPGQMHCLEITIID